MNPVDRALWYIESHFADSITLDDIAQVACASRFHLSRAFGYATGVSPMGYVRGRRLAEAARVLASGAPDILAVALQAGYGSHEAFTRAFRDQFGSTPEAVRSRGSVDDLQLLEPIRMDQQPFTELAAPRFENLDTLLVAGLVERYNDQTSAGIPAQWQRFGPHLGRIPGQVGRTAYGVLCNGDDEGNIDYICAVEVRDFSALPAEFARLRIAPQRYAVFAHRGHVAGIRGTWHTIFNQWLPASGATMLDAPQFERYGESFNPVTGMGGMEIWIPVKA